MVQECTVQGILEPPRQGLANPYDGKCDDAATLAVLQGATLVGGVYLVLKGQMDGDHLIACMFYQSQLMEYMNNLLNVFTNLYKSSGAAAKVRVGCG